MRDEESTSYTGAIEPVETFGQRIYQEAKRRGLGRAKEVCVLGDGALWIWNIADEQFYGATQIVDLYHAREHYWNVAKACFGQNKDKQHQWAEDRRQELDDGKVEEVIGAIKMLSRLRGHDKEICEREIGYFEKNRDRMRYAAFQEARPFCRLRRAGGWVSHCHRTEAETIRNALDGQRGEQYYCPPVQPSKQPVGRFLGEPGVRMMVYPQICRTPSPLRNSANSFFSLDKPTLLPPV